MNRERKARIITLLILAVALLAVVAKRSGWKAPAWNALGFAGSRRAKPQTSPQDAVFTMFDAAREGDVEKYLAAYTGAMAESVRQAAAEKTKAGFGEYLRRSNAEIKGIAISEPESLADGEVKVRVEYVYQDRNEVQFMYLEKAGEAWKISRVDAARRIETLVPYGTPVE